MSPLLRQLEEQALRLSPEDREILADALLHSLSEAPLTEIDEAWVKEAERRYQAWRTGNSQTFPDDQFFEGIRKELGWA